MIFHHSRCYCQILVVAHLALFGFQILTSHIEVVEASRSKVEQLPGFQGPLPFELETGYVGLGGREDDMQVFYYFIKSENNPEKDPLMLWLTGGPGCSSFSGLVLQIGPIAFEKKEYHGSSLPNFVLRPQSWTKVSNIIFADLPLGTGFSYAKNLTAHRSDWKLVHRTHQFLRKWLLEHPEFISNKFYIAADSYSGIPVPAVIQEISDDSQRKIHWVSWSKMGRAKSKGGMGFRGFSEFNLSLLGKQCWRLVNDSSSLMARVFKGRYYPRFDLLSAKPGFQPSYAWRSIMSARKVIEQGVRWKIGNGSQVKIWNSNWLPEQVNFKVCSPVTVLSPDALVSSLIDLDTKQWNKQLIQSIFNPFEVNQICTIPISWRLPDDKLVWHWEKHGNYSVKSAYHMLMDEKDRNVGESSSSASNLMWKALWKINVPNCVKNFMWRVAKDILPTRARLERKGIKLDTQCAICCLETETTAHLFLHCPLVQLVWFCSPLGIHTPPHSAFLDWFQHWISVTDDYAKQLFCVTLWKIWKARNDLIFNKACFIPPAIAADSNEFVTDFIAANLVVPRSISPPSTDKWMVPPSGCIKINSDAGCFPDEISAWSFIARDDAGSVLHAATHCEAGKINPSVAEALSLRWTIKWARDNHLSNCCFECDAEIVVLCCHGLKTDMAIEPIVSDCIFLLAQIPNSKISFVRRGSNQAAHALVSVAKQLGDMFWQGSVPESVSAIVCNDAKNLVSTQLLE